MRRSLRVLLVFHSFRRDTTTFAFLTDVKNLGAIQPLNLLHVGAWLRDQGHDVVLLDANAEELTLEQTLTRARAIDFDVVGFTLTNLDFLFGVAWIRAFHEAFGRPIIVGGTAPEAYPVEVASHAPITTAFHSPAEACLHLWMDAFAEGGDWWRVPGTCSVVDGEVHLNARVGLSKRFVRPHPARELTEPGRYYSLMSAGRNYTPAMSVHGCPYPCDFCAVRRLTTQIRSAQDVVDEMERCERDHGIREIDYFDAGFTISRERVLEVADLYAQRGLSVKWSARARVDRVDAEVLDAMKGMGCRWLGYGIEAAHPDVLGAIHKEQGGLATIHENLRLTQAAGIESVGFFVLGLPGESQASLQATRELLATAALDYVQISPYWPVPRTPIYDAIVRTTGRDVWRDIIVSGPQDDLPLLDTPFSMHQLHEAASGMYSSFYFRPARLLKVLRNIDSLPKLRRYVSAGLDIVRGAVPTVFGRLE